MYRPLGHSLGLGAYFTADANLQIENGNKAAGTRARKASLEVERLLPFLNFVLYP